MVAVWLLMFAFCPLTMSTFITHASFRRNSCSRSRTCVYNWSEQDKIESDSSDFSNVNPLRGVYKNEDDSGNSRSIFSRNIDVSDGISTRKYRMGKLLESLLEADGDLSTTRQILEESRDLLLQQFIDLDALLEPDSIFIVDDNIISTREGRFERYAEVMESRISNAQNGSVKRCLSSMKNFVLSQR